MGNWTLLIEGTGCHHNDNPEIDIDKLAPKLVDEIKAQGHTVQHATLTVGGRNPVVESG